MIKLLLCFFLMVSSSLYAENKFSADLSIEKLEFKRPPQGVGRAGVLIAKSANVQNNGIVLNVTNVNHMFDSQIFIRPTFLGFTTQFGNYGLEMTPDGAINSLSDTQLFNSKLIIDENQLNLSGEFFSFVNPDSKLELKTFRLYCQNVAPLESRAMGDSTDDMIKNCYSFLTLNGSFAPGNEAALLTYEGKDKKSGDLLFVKSQVESLDLRKTEINGNLKNLSSVSNNNYFINTGALNFNCAKDPDLREMDVDKIKKACLNRVKVGPLTASLIDKTANSSFKLNVKDITVKDKILYLTLNSGALSDASSTTTLNQLLLNCKKGEETDLLELSQVLDDCITYARVSIADVTSSRPDEKDSSIKNIMVNASNGALLIQSQVKFLGMKANVSMSGQVALSTNKKQLIITVTDTHLPLGINSVKLLMYFLKKNIISKDVTINKNVITVSL